MEPARGTPICGVCATLAGSTRREPLYEDELWHLRHADAPYPVAGWMMMISRRHVGGPAHFDDREARDFGLALRHFERVLEELTGALRIYTVAMGESYPHFHAHLVPRYASMPREARAWGVFDLQRAASSGEIQAAGEAEVAALSERYRRALVDRPVPR